MPPKLSCLLPDANVVIEAHRQDVWGALVASYRLVVPSTVVHLEAHFYDSPKDGRRYALDLPAMVARNEIVEWTGTATDIADVMSRFKPGFSQSLDLGEVEALACLLSGDEPDAVFVTADGPAIQATAMLGMPERGTCLEDVLRRCGHGRKLPAHHCEAFFARELADGNTRFVTREGLTD